MARERLPVDIAERDGWVPSRPIDPDGRCHGAHAHMVLPVTRRPQAGHHAGASSAHACGQSRHSRVHSGSPRAPALTIQAPARSMRWVVRRSSCTGRPDRAASDALLVYECSVGPLDSRSVATVFSVQIRLLTLAPLSACRPA